MSRKKRAITFAIAVSVLAGTLTLAPDASPTTAARADEEECAPGVMARLPGPPPALAAMGIDAGERQHTGAGVTVAIVDSGVDGTRPQLASAFAPGSTSFIDDGQRSDGLGDQHGHGTALAGIIAARADAASGVVGVAPDAQIISLRVFRSDDDESKKAGFGPEAERMAEAIRTAAQLGADIITVALSDDVDTPALRDATAAATAQGSLVVASAGNRNTSPNTEDTPRYPAAYPGALSVSAFDANGMATQASIHGEHVDVAAPGQEVLSTSVGGGDCRFAIDEPSSSFATAYAAGAAALVAGAYPAEGPEKWAYRLKAAADRSDPDARDNKLGWGRIRPLAAIDLRPASTTRGPESPFADTSGAAFETPASQVTTRPTSSADASALSVIAVVAAGIVALCALGAILRTRLGARRASGAGSASGVGSGTAGFSSTAKQSRPTTQARTPPPRAQNRSR